MRFYQASLLILLVICSGAFAAQGQRKTDIITLYNGDKVTGEIITLFGGILELKTDSMGTIKIEWPEISSVQSKYHYEVRISDGDRLYGSLEAPERPGQIALTDLYGKHEIEWLNVVEIRPIEDSFAERLDIYLSAGFSLDRASSVSQTTLNTSISYEDEKSRNTLTGRSTLTDTDTDSTSSLRFDISRMVWTEKRDDIFRATFANYENNDELALEYRIGAGAGLGTFFIDSHRSRFMGTAGLQVITEKQLEGGTSQDVEAILNASFSRWEFSTPELQIDLSFTLYPSLTDSGRVRSDSSLRLRWELIEDLFLDFSGWASTDNQGENDNNVDYGLTTGIGWTY